MPELDGFQTARELKQSGSRARIVMMTMHDADEFVAAAIDSGAHGYVLKTRMQSDLSSAIDHAIAGRLFVPSLTSLLGIGPAPGRHAMLLGTEPRLFLDDVSRLLAAAMRRGDMAAIIATEATRDGVAERLLARGCDLAKATDRGTYVWVDAAAGASDVVVSGRLDATRVASFIGELERSRLAVGAPNLTVVGVAAIAPLLFAEGNHEAAIQLERTWDDLTRRLPFLTVCCYLSASFEGGSSELFPQICDPHSATCHAHATFGRVV
jgi:hypothetical protein